jgi:exodeoxyribonuclease (lambda-induced)
MKEFYCDQYSEEWFLLRQKRVTSSKATAIANAGLGLKTYINSLMADYYSSAKQINFCNEAMRYGLETESQARTIFELEYSTKVKQIGFIAYNDFVGGSPDGLIDKNTIIEIKCFSDHVYFDYLMTKKIKSDHLWQCQMNLLISNRSICKYIAYNPNFEKYIIIQDIYSNPEMHDKLLKGFELAENKIKEIIQKME